MEDINKKRKRRSRNEGMIRWIESKQLWEARYPVGTKEYTGKDGKQRSKTEYKSIYGKKNEKGLLVKKMREALTALGKGEYVEPSDKTLIKWCQEWFETHKKPSIRTNTREKYLTSIARLKRYDIAKMPLKTLNLELIQKFYNSLSDEGFSQETIKATHSLINGALEKAEELKMVIKNEARKTIIPKNDILLFDEDEAEKKALTEEQEKAFLYQLGRRTKHFMYALFMDNTGLRPGEALALNRSDIDTKKRTVKVTKTYLEKQKKIQNATKTESSRRTIPIPADIIKLLDEYMLKQPNKKPNDPLFQTEKGKRPTMSYLRKRFKYAGKAIGCEWVTLHTMRHTYASKLFREKVDIKVISKLLGHKDVSTTYDIYVHFIDNVVEDSVQVLNNGLPEALPEKSRKGEQKIKKNNNKIIELKKVSTN
ncbi:site-specific integrase [Ruminiclostridium herbifermentans]|uniref:Site-specific integrase n=1 Tax=Ruminiclostridium herbifermentans TaxID=2488810 RepID=A0A4V6ENY1_9FIRM|nr:site-specific integrase [Ruminiclostridium herbifermentans]QNU67231.1 site-specific integrase [Ruminiclostridium herbifermentans]